MSTRLPDTLKVEDELFALGLDSLKAAKIVRHINASLEEIGRGGGPRFLPSTIYANPSVSQMASKVIAMTWEDSQTNDTPSARDRVTDRRSLSVQYGQDLPMNGRKAKEVNPKTPEVLILTGSTGSVGSYLLDALLKDQSISKVYCFNRANNTAPEVRQHQANKANGLATLSRHLSNSRPLPALFWTFSINLLAAPPINDPHPA